MGISAGSVRWLQELGFDLNVRSRTGGYRVRCSQCEALVINGVPCHEAGCPNTPKPEIVEDEDNA